MSGTLPLPNYVPVPMPPAKPADPPKTTPAPAGAAAPMEAAGAAPPLPPVPAPADKTAVSNTGDKASGGGVLPPVPLGGGWGGPENDAFDFNLMDGNHDGVLSGSERALAGTDGARFDADGNGEVSKAEFERGRAIDRFRLKDTNGDGVLTGDEAKDFQGRDTNGDKDIHFAEYAAGEVVEQAAQRDANHDGYLSGNEITPELEKYAQTLPDGRKVVKLDALRAAKVAEFNGRPVTPGPNGPLPGPNGPTPTPGPGGSVTPSSGAAAFRQAAEKAMTSRGGGGFGKVERDIADSNNISAARQEQCKQVLAANQAAEQEQLGKLDATQRAQYDRIKASLEGNPAAQMNLACMLSDGKLTNSPNASDGQTLLASLDNMTQMPTAQGIDRKALLGQMVNEMSIPSCINQKNRGTCTVTSIQIKTAMEHPAEYARIMTGLASPSGEVKLAGGASVHRFQGFNREDGTNRSISGRIWQSTMIRLAGGTQNSGATAQGMDRVMENIWGRKVDTYTGRGMMSKISEAANGGNPVPICMNGHAVLVTGVRNGRVYIHNPWGAEESFSQSYFQSRVNAANILTKAG